MKKLVLYAFALTFTTAVNAQTATIQQTPKGAQYQIFTHNTGPKIKLDDIVTFNVTQKTEKDSLLFSSYNAAHPIQIKIMPSQSVADLMEVFPLLTVKDSAVVRVPADSVFKGHEQDRPAFLPAKSSIVITVKIEKVQSLADAIAERNAASAKLQQNEGVAAEQFITSHKIAAKTTVSGLRYVITSQSKLTRKPLPGDTVMVNYVGRNLNGKVFDSSVQAVAKEANLQQPGRNYEPIRVVINQGQVIPGWDEGLQLMTEGSTAQFIIPSKLGYGAQGAGQDIAPYSTLVFDINLLRIYPTKHAAPVAKTTTAVKKKTTATTKKKVTH